VKPIHLLTGHPSARIVCAKLTDCAGVKATFGKTIPGWAKYVVTPAAEATPLAAKDILELCQRLHDSGMDFVRTPVCEVRLASAVGSPMARAATGPVATGKADGIAVAVTCHAAYMPLLPACLAAVEAQTLKPAEKYLALDGCELSRQQEYDLLAKGWQIRIGKWGSPNPGRQWALDATKCQWIWHVDADDAHRPEYLAGATGQMASPRVAIVHADRARTDGVVLQAPEGTDYWGMRRQNYVDTSSVWRVEVLRAAGGWRDLKRWDDWDCALRVTETGWQTARNPVPSLCTAHADGSNRNAMGNDFMFTWGRSVDVVCLLAGRTAFWSDWSDRAAGMEYPDRTHVWLCDNSQNPDYRANLLALACALSRRGVAATVLPLAERYANVDWLSRHQHVARLYSRVLSQTAGDLTVLWEDDVIPPGHDSLRNLLGQWHAAHVGGVCALYESRDRPGYACASLCKEFWGDCPPLADARGKVVKDCGFLPGGFAVYNTGCVKQALPLFISFPDGKHLMGWDGLMGLAVRRAGLRLDLVGTIECEHRWAEPTTPLHPEPVPEPAVAPSH